MAKPKAYYGRPRSAVTGKFVSAGYAKRYPDRTIVERVYVAKRRGC